MALRDYRIGIKLQKDWEDKYLNEIEQRIDALCPHVEVAHMLDDSMFMIGFKFDEYRASTIDCYRWPSQTDKVEQFLSDTQKDYQTSCVSIDKLDVDIDTEERWFSPSIRNRKVCTGINIGPFKTVSYNDLENLLESMWELGSKEIEISGEMIDYYRLKDLKNEIDYRLTT
jgi:hypothetical protein